MICGRCHTNNLDDARFCSTCGNVLPAAFAAPRIQAPSVGPPASAGPPSNSQATISLVLGLGSTVCSCVTGIPAIIFGILALQKPGGRGRAWAGIALGLLTTVAWGTYLAVRGAAIQQAVREPQSVAAQVPPVEPWAGPDEKRPVAKAHDDDDLRTPDDEKTFCQSIASSARAYAAAKKSGAKEATLGKLGASRRAALRKALGVGRINHWTGTVAETSVSRQGLAILLIKLPCGASVGTWNNALADVGSDSLIPQSSPIYDAATDLRVEQPVVFGGSLVPDEASVDGYKEMAISEDSSATEPQYLIKFSELAAAHSAAPHR